MSSVGSVRRADVGAWLRYGILGGIFFFGTVLGVVLDRTLFARLRPALA